MGTRGRTSKQRQYLNAFRPVHALCFLAGLSSVYLYPALQPYLWLPLLPIAVLCLTQYRYLVLPLGIILAGALWISYAAHHRLESQWPEFRHGEDITVAGHVVSISARSFELSRFIFDSDELAGRVRVSWYRHQGTLQVGQCWNLTLRMKSPRGSVNPGGFDYEGWLFQQGIIATAYVREATPCQPALMHTKSTDLRESMHAYLENQLASHRMKHIVMALSMGERDDFTDSDWTLLRHTGTSHLMAISGLHIGIVAGWVYLIMGLLWRLLPLQSGWLTAHRSGLLVSIVAAVIYTWLSGAGLPALRAMTMLGFFYIALWAGRVVSPFQLLALAMVVVLAVDPFSIGQAGFWLSFVAVFCIFFLLSNRWTLLGRLKVLLLIQLCLSLSLAPLSLFWFGELSWIAPLVNLILVPIFSLLVPVVLLAVIWVLLAESSGAWVLEKVADTLGLIWDVLRWVDDHVLASYAIPGADIVSVCIAIPGLLLLFSPRYFPAKWLGILFLIPLFILPENTRDALRLTVLDVGQGLSVVIESEGKTLLFDAGPAYKGGFDAGAMVVLPYLRSRNISEIDVLVQSHGDMDHRGGVPAVMAQMPVDALYGSESGSPCVRGHAWQWDDVVFEFLHPDADGWSGNNSSCVLKISKFGYVVLLTGDIERQAEQHLVADMQGQLKANILVVPHHGSASSSSTGFINRVQPEIAVFSAGWNNRWGFPADEVIRRYERQGVRLFSTAQQGAVIIDITREGGILEPVSWRDETQRLWRTPKSMNIFGYFD